MKERVAREGYWLTQASLEDETGRAFAKNICGFGDLDNLFTEWSDSQKAQWEEEHPIEEDNYGEDSDNQE